MGKIGGPLIEGSLTGKHTLVGVLQGGFLATGVSFVISLIEYVSIVQKLTNLVFFSVCFWSSRSFHTSLSVHSLVEISNGTTKLKFPMKKFFTILIFALCNILM